MDTSVLRREHYVESSKRGYVISIEIKKLTYNRTKSCCGTFFFFFFKYLLIYVRSLLYIIFIFANVAHVSGLVMIVNDRRCFELRSILYSRYSILRPQRKRFCFEHKYCCKSQNRKYIDLNGRVFQRDSRALLSRRRKQAINYTGRQ